LEQDPTKLAERRSLLEKQEKLSKIWEELNMLNIQARAPESAASPSEDVTMVDEDDE
jgi:hypothetical protein